MISGNIFLHIFAFLRNSIVRLISLAFLQQYFFLAAFSFMTIMSAEVALLMK